jgi:hypothetical protein
MAWIPGKRKVVVMRELTVVEMESVVGGLIPIEDPVFGYGSTGSDPIGQPGSGSAAPSVPGGSQGSAGGGGGSGSPSGSYAAGGYKHTTPGGHRYSMQMRISDAQYKVLDAVVDYGYAHNASQQAIQTAAVQAYYESSFGQNLVNPTSNATGLFQYMPKTWSDYGFAGSITSNTDQVVAIYQEIDKFTARYNDNKVSQAIPATMTFNEYFEVKHHLGDSSQSWDSSVVTEINDASLVMSFHTADE